MKKLVDGEKLQKWLKLLLPEYDFEDGNTKTRLVFSFEDIETAISKSSLPPKEKSKKEV